MSPKTLVERVTLKRSLVEIAPVQIKSPGSNRPGFNSPSFKRSLMSLVTQMRLHIQVWFYYSMREGMMDDPYCFLNCKYTYKYIPHVIAVSHVRNFTSFSFSAREIPVWGQKPYFTACSVPTTDSLRHPVACPPTVFSACIPTVITNKSVDVGA